MTPVFSSCYFGSIPYIAALFRQNNVIIDIHERFQKQSNRSRTTILGANGPLYLSVPVVRPNGQETSMRDVLISYDEDWQKDHWKSIESAYNHSPYLEHYGDDIHSIIYANCERLIELNQLTLDWVNKSLDLNLNTKLSEEVYPFQRIDDPREIYNSKRYQGNYNAYTQVFSDKLVFHPHLSILDLILNQGPMARNYL